MKIINYTKLLERVRSDQKVLDIGGWEKPFNRANVIIDIMPYETRKVKNSFPVGMKECFSKEDWIFHDIGNPLPFRDKEFDFSVCGHVLEDIKDPVFLCKELMRVSKAGYIEFPNRAFEMKSSDEVLPNSHKYVGYNHHRWLIEVQGNKLIFLQKRCMYSVMKILRCRKIASKFTGFFWQDNFQVQELFFNSYDNLMEEALKFRAKNDKVSFNYLYKKYKFIKPWLKGIAKIRSYIANRFIPD